LTNHIAECTSSCNVKCLDTEIVLSCIHEVPDSITLVVENRLSKSVVRGESEILSIVIEVIEVHWLDNKLVRGDELTRSSGINTILPNNSNGVAKFNWALNSWCKRWTRNNGTVNTVACLGTSKAVYSSELSFNALTITKIVLWALEDADINCASWASKLALELIKFIESHDFLALISDVCVDFCSRSANCIILVD
jgi:hypothetical protein